MTSLLFRPQSVLLFVTVLWGSTFAATKFMLNEQIPPVLYVAFRYLFGALTLVVLLPWLERKQTTHHGLFEGIARKALLLGLLQAAGIVFQAVGQEYTTVSKSSFLTSFSVPLTPLLGWLISRERPRWIQLLAIGIGGCGMLLLAVATSPTTGATNAAQERFNVGDVLTLCSAVVYGVVTVQTVRIARPAFALRLAVAQTVIASGLLLGFWALVHFADVPLLHGLHRKEFRPWTLDLRMLLVWGYMSLVCTALTFPLQSWAMARIQTNQAAVILATEPIFATGLAVWLLHDPWPGIQGLIGAACIVAAVLISELAGKRHKQPVLHPTP